MSSFSTENETKLLEIENFLANNAYLSGKPLPNENDTNIFFALKNAPAQDKYPNFYFWYGNLLNFNPQVVHSWATQVAKEVKPTTTTAAAAEIKKEEKKVEAAAEDDLDLFGADDGDAEAEAKALAEKKKAEADAKKKKEKPPAKSILIFDVKVYEQETDLLALAKKIKETIKMDGLVWNQQHHVRPVAFGMNKLELTCIIEDEKVSQDDIFDLILADDEVVQSCDVVQFQKH